MTHRSKMARRRSRRRTQPGREGLSPTRLGIARGVQAPGCPKVWDSSLLEPVARASAQAAARPEVAQLPPCAHRILELPSLSQPSRQPVARRGRGNSSQIIDRRDFKIECRLYPAMVTDLVWSRVVLQVPCARQGVVLLHSPRIHHVPERVEAGGVHRFRLDLAGVRTCCTLTGLKDFRLNGRQHVHVHWPQGRPLEGPSTCARSLASRTSA